MSNTETAEPVIFGSAALDRKPLDLHKIMIPDCTQLKKTTMLPSTNCRNSQVITVQKNTEMALEINAAKRGHELQPDTPMFRPKAQRPSLLRKRLHKKRSEEQDCSGRLTDENTADSS